MTRETSHRGAKRVICLFALVLIMIARSEVAETQTAQQEKTVEQTRKNIQVLKGLPESQLFPVMNFIGQSLGVHCDYCHVINGTNPKTGADNWVWESDEKLKKLVARAMMKMVLDINKASFGGGQTVTCYSCHRGAAGVARLAPSPPRDFAVAGADKNQAALPTAEQILKKYIAAVGGEKVVANVKTVLMKGTLERAQGRNADRSLNMTRDAVEITLKGPDKYLVRMTTAQGVLLQCINGTVAWVSSNDGARQLSADDLDRVKRVPARYGIIKVTESPERMKVIGVEVIGGRQAYVVATRIDPNRARRYFFDTETGLLLREVTTTETMLAPLPEQVDFEDYRDVDGVKLPFTILTSDVAAFSTARRKLTEIKLNVAVEDAVFNMPSTTQ
jgi:hypothetical protein